MDIIKRITTAVVVVRGKVMFGINEGKMNFLLVSYENYGANGRLREFIKCFEQIGNVQAVFLNYHGEKTNMQIRPCCINVNIGYKTKSPITFLKLILAALIKFYQKRSVDYLVICNTPACISGYILKKIYPKKKIIYDAYELKLPENRKKRMEKFFSWFEQKIIKCADIVVCANEERAQIMMTFYDLDKKPIVFENIRKIEETGHIRECIKNIIESMDDEKLNLISTGGYNVDRGADRLVLAMKKFEQRHVLYIVGSGSNDDKKIIEKLIISNDIKNVIIVGQINQRELNSLAVKCDIGIVQYHQNDFNNKYCASGKIYEYLEKGLAVVTTTNPPLLEFCNKYKVGIAADDYVEGIVNVSSKLQEYKKNAKKCSQLFNSVENNKKFISELYCGLRIEKD